MYNKFVNILFIYIKLNELLFEIVFIYLFENNIGDIGSKYLVLGLSKLNKLNHLLLDL